MRSRHVAPTAALNSAMVSNTGESPERNFGTRNPYCRRTAHRTPDGKRRTGYKPDTVSPETAAASGAAGIALPGSTGTPNSTSVLSHASSAAMTYQVQAILPMWPMRNSFRMRLPWPPDIITPCWRRMASMPVRQAAEEVAFGIWMRRARKEPGRPSCGRPAGISFGMRSSNGPRNPKDGCLASPRIPTLSSCAFCRRTTIKRGHKNVGS